MARVLLLCGPVGAGKTTFARQLERELGAMRFSIDEWMLRFYPEDVPRELFHERLGLCMGLIYDLSERLLELGTAVVLDCGYWRREHRARAYERLGKSGAAIELYYFDTPAELRWSRLEQRNVGRDAGTYEITREMFDFFGTCFEPPAPPEAFVLARSDRK